VASSIEVGVTDTTRFWNLYSATYDALNHSIPYDQHMRMLVDRLELRPGLRIVDLGCGTGNLETRLGSLASADVEVEVVGLDFSAKMLERARRKTASWPGITYQQADLSAGIPLDDASVDVVVSNNFIYSVSDKESLLAEIHRILRPGGRVVISDPRPDSQIPLVIRAHFTEISRMSQPRKALQYAKTAVSLPFLGLPPIILSKLFIDSRRRATTYEFCTEDRLRSLFAGFEHLEIVPVYAEQSWLVEASKGL